MFISFHIHTDCFLHPVYRFTFLKTRMYREKFRSHKDAQVTHGEKKWEKIEEDLKKVYTLVYSGDTKCIYALVHENTL